MCCLHEFSRLYARRSFYDCHIQHFGLRGSSCAFSLAFASTSAFPVSIEVSAAMGKTGILKIVVPSSIFIAIDVSRRKCIAVT